MKTSVEPLEGNKVKVSVEVDESELEPAIDAAFKRIAREVRLPGFRPGKAPRKLLEARIGTAAAREEAFREALPDFYARAVRDHEVDVIAAPEIDITAGQEAGPVAFDAVVEIRPRVQVAGYDALRVEIPSPTPSEDDVEAQLDRLRDQYAELETVERPADEGDRVLIDIEGTRDGEPVEGMSATDYLYEVGLGAVGPELDEALRGASAGDELAVDVAEEGHEDHDHGPLHLEVTVKEVREQLLPELTDEWAREASEFDTVEELRADLRDQLVRTRAAQAEMAVREKTAEALAALVDDEIPEALVSNEVQSRLQDLAMRLQAQGLELEQYLQLTGRDPQAFIAELRESADQAVRVDLALRAVAEAEGIEPTDDDLEQELAEVAERVGQPVDVVRSTLEQQDQLPGIRSELRQRAALAWLVERVEIVDPDGNPIDRADLQPPADEDDQPDDAEVDEVDHDGSDAEPDEGADDQ